MISRSTRELGTAGPAATPRWPMPPLSRAAVLPHRWGGGRRGSARTLELRRTPGAPQCRAWLRNALRVRHPLARPARGVELRERKRVPQAFLGEFKQTQVINYLDHIEGRGVLRRGVQGRLERIVSKKSQDVHRSRRSRSWLKTKCVHRHEFVVVGWTDPGGSRVDSARSSSGTTRPRGADVRRKGRHGVQGRHAGPDQAETRGGGGEGSPATHAAHAGAAPAVN